MPNIHSIYKTMRMKKHNIPQEILAALGFDCADLKIDSRDTKHTFGLLVKINDLLTVEQKYAIMEQQGCHKTGKMNEASKKFAAKYADKSLAERLRIMSSKEEASYPEFAEEDAPYLNDDGTLSLAVRCYVGDINGVLRSCHCLDRNYKAEFKSFIEEHPDKILSFSQFFCGCCAAHAKHHLQNKLDVKLKLKSIDTSPVKTDNGNKRVFTYEIVK